jgi:heme exporter protein CcmD
MNSLGDWLAMGGYAGFVWPCYLLAAVLMIGLALQAWLRLAAARRGIAEIEGDDAARSGASRPGGTRGRGR